MSKKSRNKSYFDDCTICQTMKKADESGRSLSSQELEKVFAEANKKQELKKQRTSR